MTGPIATLPYTLIPHRLCSKDPRGAYKNTMRPFCTIILTVQTRKTEAQRLSNLPKVAGGKEMVEMRFWILRFLVGRTEQEK